MTMRAVLGPQSRNNAVTFSEPLAHCVVNCYACAEACTVCADACLSEPNVEDLRQCIRRTLDCAELCGTLASIASRRTGDNSAVLGSLLETCAIACRVCVEECGHHGEMHDHCRTCAEACSDCADACRGAMSTVH